MDMKTFKTLEFAAIFGAIGYFWWSQRQDRLRRDEADREQSKTDAESSGPEDDA
jgi:hypothetical protein